MKNKSVNKKFKNGGYFKSEEVEPGVTVMEMDGKGFVKEILKNKPIKPTHRRYCAKSNMSCLVHHSDGICPDVRDCEACKSEKPTPPPMMLDDDIADWEHDNLVENG